MKCKLYVFPVVWIQSIQLNSGLIASKGDLILALPAQMGSAEEEEAGIQSYLSF